MQYKRFRKRPKAERNARYKVNIGRKGSKEGKDLRGGNGCRTLLILKVHNVCMYVTMIRSLL